MHSPESGQEMAVATGAVRLSECLAPAFWPVHAALNRGEATHFWLAGGRGSGKSSFASLELVFRIMAEGGRGLGGDALVLRRYGVTLRESVFAQLLWAVQMLGVQRWWRANLAPMRLTYLPTGQEVLFRGLDDPAKLKSIRGRGGRFCFLWLEEAEEVEHPGILRSVLQSVMRGEGAFTALYSFNPPRSKRHWLNQPALAMRPDSMLHHSDYRQMPPHWLGPGFLAEADYLRRTDPDSYRHEYLGIAVGQGGEAFPNLVVRCITEEERSRFCNRRRGIDWGFAGDPFVYLSMELDRGRRQLLIDGEFYRVGASFEEIAREIRRENPWGEPVVADSAEPRSNAELKERGVRILPARKGPGSVSHGIRWLQGLGQIVIDPVRCPNAAREFAGYALEETGSGRGAAYPDRDNHTIDAARYACEQDMHRSGVSF